jgi:histidine triad (HIT) family protein
MARPCLFCSIVSAKLPAIIIYDDDNHIALMDKYPLSLGHALVIPKLHHANLLSMTPYQFGSLYSVVYMISKAITSAVNADGFSIGQNNGRAANQIIPHVHVHIVPRFANDSQEGKWPSRTVGDLEQMAQTAQKIQSALNAYKRTEISQYRS